MAKKQLWVLAFAGMTVCGLSADWPQFLGPNRDGVSAETDVARAWPPEGPKALWTFPLGEGFGGAAIRDGQVYVLDRINDAQDVLRCLDLASGKELWNFAHDVPGILAKNGSRAVPTVDVDNVYCVGPFGDVYCVSRKTHQLVWHVNLPEEFGGKLANWGASQSPTLYKNSVIMAAQGQKAGLAALDKNTTGTLWRSAPLQGGESYVSPRLTTIDGVDQLIMLTAGGEKKKAAGQVSGIDANDGKVLWTYDGFQCQIPITAPTPLGEGRVLVTGGYNAGAVMLQVKKQGQQFAVTELWKSPELNSQIHQPLLIGGCLYANSNSNSSHEGMECLTLDGQLKWRTGRQPNFERGNLILAGGVIINQDGNDGCLRLVEPSPEAYKQLAEANLGLSKMAWGPMALSEGRLVIRDQQQMMCLDVRNP